MCLVKVFSKLRFKASTCRWETLSLALSLLSSSVTIVPFVFALLGCSRGASGILDAPWWSLLLWALMRSLGTGMLMTPPLVIRMSLALGLPVSDSSWLLGGESALTSGGELDASASSFLEGRGMDTKLSALTWSLPYRQLKAVSL